MHSPEKIPARIMAALSAVSAIPAESFSGCLLSFAIS
jgi:hypothetical protein